MHISMCVLMGGGQKNRKKELTSKLSEDSPKFGNVGGEGDVSVQDDYLGKVGRQRLS